MIFISIRVNVFKYEDEIINKSKLKIQNIFNVVKYLFNYFLISVNKIKNIMINH